MVNILFNHRKLIVLFLLMWVITLELEVLLPKGGEGRSWSRFESAETDAVFVEIPSAALRDSKSSLVLFLASQAGRGLFLKK